MMKQKIWHKTSKHLMRPNYKCIKCKLLFKIKYNSIRHAWLIACASSSVLWINFSKNFLPVMNDIMLRALLLMMILIGFSAKVVDVETTVLFRELEDEIKM